MNDLLTRAWHALTPEQRPEGLFRLFRHTGDFCDAKMYLVGDAAAYDRLCLACERVLRRERCVPSFRAKGEWDGGRSLDADLWEWYFYSESVSHTCQLTAAVLAIEAMKGGDK